MKEIDLSIGAPTEPVSAAVLSELAKANWQVGYPLAAGSENLKNSVVNWAKKLLKIEISPLQVMPVAGAKEFVGTLPWLLNLDQNSTICIPHLSYPTYQDGAFASKSRVIRYRSVEDLLSLDKIDLMWINSPNNPTGEVLSEAELFQLLNLAQQKQALVVSDETYLETALENSASSALAIAQQQKMENVLGLYSLSKRNSLAAFRVGYVIGEAAKIESLIVKRRKLGLLANSPATQLASELLKDFSYPEKIRKQFKERRDTLLPALSAKGLINHSPGGMFLWLSGGESGENLTKKFSDLNIKVAPGIWYGPAGENFIRISLTLSAADAEEFVNRIKNL